MDTKKTHRTLTYFIAFVWLINGLFCKVLNLVPRHREIVGRILGYDHAQLLTLLIGISESAMAIWIVSAMYPKLNAFVQILVIASMNALEFILVPDLLLWGRTNAFFALFFILLIYFNEFHLNRKIAFKTITCFPL
jgi:hypothetical protein